VSDGRYRPTSSRDRAPRWGPLARGFAFLAFAAGVVFVVSIGASIAPPKTDHRREEAEAEQRRTAERLAENRLIKLDFDWRKGGFDAVMIATFRISNGNPFAIKDIGIVCTLSAPSGTTLGLNAVTLYQVIPAKGRKTIRDLNMGRPVSLDFGQAAGASCEISKFHKA
jgi:hypothetical protein